jgi:hypothetical protein
MAVAQWRRRLGGWAKGSQGSQGSQDPTGPAPRRRRERHVKGEESSVEATITEAHALRMPCAEIFQGDGR